MLPVELLRLVSAAEIPLPFSWPDVLLTKNKNTTIKLHHLKQEATNILLALSLQSKI